MGSSTEIFKVIVNPVKTRKTAKTAVVVHLYHQDVWAFIAKRLEALQGDWDLHLTLSEDTVSQLEAELRARFPQAQLHIYPNQGMDMLPFLRLVPYLVEQGYQQLLKLHTKKGSTDFGPAWGEYLIDALIGHPQAITQAATAFTQEPQLALLGPAAFYLSDKKLMLNNQSQLLELIQDLATPAASQVQLPEQDWGFFAGSMFWTRPCIWLKLAQWAETQASNFDADYAQDGQLPHAIERVFGLLPALSNQPVGLLQPTQPGLPPSLQLLPAQQLLVNQAGSQKLIQAYQGLKQNHPLFTQAGLLDTAKYQAFLKKRGFLENQPCLDLISHYLLIGQFSGGRYCSQAWKLHLQNQQIDWSVLARQKRQPGFTSIVMPVFNQAELTQQAVETVVKHTAPGSYELLLVDNGSDTSTRQLLSQLEKRHQAVKVHRLEKNLFFALGSNLGFAQTKGEYTVFLNNDTEVQTNWLPPLLQALVQQAVYAAQPLLFYPDGSVQCMGVVFSDKSNLGYPIYRGMQPKKCRVDEPRQFQAITAACMAIRSELFAKVQGFDPIYINGQEDIDLCLRLKEKTQQNAAYVPNSQVIHHESKTPGRGKHIDQNRWVFVQRWRAKLTADDQQHYRQYGNEPTEYSGDRLEAPDISALKFNIKQKVFTEINEEELSMSKVESTLLQRANKAFSEGEYKLALDYYKKLASSEVELSSVSIFNLKLVLARLTKRSIVDVINNDDYSIDRAVAVINEKDSIEAQRKSGFFDVEYYKSKNPDIAEAGVDPVRHFHMHGWKEGRNPSSEFDLKFYTKKYEKYIGGKKNPLLYHIRSGAYLGFAMSKKPRGAATASQLSKVFTENRQGPDLFEEIALKGELYRLFKNRSLEDELTISEITKAKEISQGANLSISVIVPMWNRQETIRRAIDSILNQSYQASEIIVVDDGSDDFSCQVVKDCYASYIEAGKLILVENKHLGVSAARSTGLRRATSELVCYLDSDNEWNSNYLLVMSAIFSENAAISTAYAGLKHIDVDKNTVKYLGKNYDRRSLVQANYIDMNVFCHRKIVSDQIGGFDEDLKRLVDWDYILRCTKLYSPIYVPFCAVDYYLDEKGLSNISRTVPLDDNRLKVFRKHTSERLKYELESLKLAYVLWDWPALSQTFVLEEIRWLISQGQDVIVYYKVDPDRSATLDFEVESRKVDGSEQLAKYLIEDERNIIHSHFAYPAVTLLAYPAAKSTGIPFTFYAHAVDIFHENNKKRNRVGEIVNDNLCLRVFVHGEYHRQVLEEAGVNPSKIFYAMQAVDLDKFWCEKKKTRSIKRIAFVGRFVEKKGINILLSAAELLKNEDFSFDLYGYGPLYDEMVKYSKDRLIKNVNFKGALEGSDALNTVFEQCDALVVPSVVAKNGDTEGFPTIIFEAMAANVPVIASAVSSVPSYLKDGVEALLVEPGDHHALAQKIKSLNTMPVEKRLALQASAKEFLNKNVGVEKLIQSYVDCWFDNHLDIFLVTFNNEKYENTKETFEIINRLLNHTNSPFTLTVIDNNSNKVFKEKLVKIAENDTRIRLILNLENGFCGPASNTALWASGSRFSIYVCSKEGFVAKHGWDRVILNEFRYEEKTALGGHLVHLPKYTFGKELKSFPGFEDFRGKEYVDDVPSRVFMHVQGGVFILDRSSLKDLKGFNPRIPQGGMDIELSYFAESKGYKLKSIPQIKSVTTKTLPRIHSALDENTVIAHPFTYDEAISRLDAIHSKHTYFCNICGALDVKLNEDGLFGCCSSTPFGRSIFKTVAYHPSAFRGGHALVASDDPSLTNKLSDRMFKVERLTALKEAINGLQQTVYSMIIVDFDYLFASENFDQVIFEKIFVSLKDKLCNGGMLAFAISKHYPQSIKDLIGCCADGSSNSASLTKSNVIVDDWRTIHTVENIL